MAEPNARVAVIIPCYDEGALVAEAAHSVKEREPVELVVVADATRDAATLRTLERLEAEGVRVLRHEQNRGPGAARMTGVRATRAPYLFALDGDDLAVQGSLAVLADCLDANPGAGLCLADYEIFGHHEIERSTPARLDPYRIAYRNEYPVGSTLFQRSVLEAAGGWRAVQPGVHGYQDWDLLMTLAERGTQSVHAPAGVRSLRYRRAAPSMLDRSRRRHRALYRQLRRRHPRLFAELGRHRRESDLGAAAKLLYPVVFGGRPRLAIEHRLRGWLRR